MANYEIVAVLRPDLEEEAIEAAIGRVHQRITEHGGTVTSTDRWGKRRLAYVIQKYRDGYYVLSVFSLESGQVARLRATLGLNEALLRFVVAEHHPAPVRAAAPAAAAAAPVPATAPATGTTSTPATGTAPAPSTGAAPASAPAATASTGGGSPAAGAEGTHV